MNLIHLFQTQLTHSQCGQSLNFSSLCAGAVLAAISREHTMSSSNFPRPCIDGSPPGSPVPGILQARILEWVAISSSNAQQPHGLQPTRLLRPWDFPGKSTGVGCYFLLLLFLFLTQGLNPGLPHCRQTLYHLSPQGSPKRTEAEAPIIWLCPTSACQTGLPWSSPPA